MAYALDDATRKRLGLPANYGASSYTDQPDATAGQGLAPDPVAASPLIPSVGGPDATTNAPDVSIKPPAAPPLGGDVSKQPVASQPAQPAAPGGGDAAPFVPPPPPPPPPPPISDPAASVPQTPSGTGPLSAPAQYVPGAAYDIPGYGSVTWDAQGHPAIGSRNVDYNGNPIVAPSMSQAASLALNDMNSAYNQPATVVQPNVSIPGGTAEMVQSYGLLGKLKPQFAQFARTNPTATIGDAVRAGIITKQDYVDAGMGFQTGFDDDWMNRSVSELTPNNIQIQTDPNARNGGYFDDPSNTSSGYHPANENGAYGLNNGQYVNADGSPYASTAQNPQGLNPAAYAQANGGAVDPNPQPPNGGAGGVPQGPATQPQASVNVGDANTGTGPAGQRPIPSIGGGDAGINPPTLPTTPQFPTISPADRIAAANPLQAGIPSVGGNAAPVPSLSPIDPNNDLRSKQINPTTPAQTPYANIPVTDSARTSQFDTLQGNAANAVGNGASRSDIAKGYLDAFDEAAQPKIRDQIQSVYRDYARRGGLGMGDAAADTLRPVTDYATQRSAYAKQLASDSAAGDIQDRLNNLNALDSTQAQSYGQDANNRNELRTDRNFTYDNNRNAVNDAANARNELRTERGYQYGSEQDALNASIQQYLMEQQGQQQDFNRGNTLAGLGYGNSPANLLFGAGQQYGQNAGMDWQALAGLLGPYLYR